VFEAAKVNSKVKVEQGLPLNIIQQLCSMKQKHTKYTEINTNKSMHSEMGPV